MKIFVASTGRCGTVFMADMFRQLTNIPSFHEPKPWCNGDFCYQVNNCVRFSKPVMKMIEEKVAQVKKDSVRGCYFESNQMFIKSYVNLMLSRFKDVYCIYLYRNPVEVLLSYYNKCRERETEWFLQSNWTKNILETKRKKSFYANILWQCDEIEERYLFYKERFIKTFQFDFRRINDPEEWKRLFKRFRIKYNDFDKLPIGLTNRIDADRRKTLDALIENWDKPGKEIKKMKPELEKLSDSLNFARRMVAINEVEMYGCRM